MKFRRIPPNIRRHVSIVYSQRNGILDRCLLSMVFVHTEIVLLPGSIYEIISHSACQTRLINFMSPDKFHVTILADLVKLK